MKVQLVTHSQKSPTQRATLDNARLPTKSWPLCFKISSLARKIVPNFQKSSKEEEALMGGNDLDLSKCTKLKAMTNLVIRVGLFNQGDNFPFS